MSNLIKFPLNISIEYIADDKYPVNTISSTHYLQGWTDIDVLTSFINVFSCGVFEPIDVFDLIILAQNNAGTSSSKYDENLTIKVN